VAGKLRPVEIEAGGKLKLPSHVQRAMRAPIGTQFAPVPTGESILVLLRLPEDGRMTADRVAACSMLGQVGSFGIADLFSALNMGQKTGVISFEQGSIVKEVYFEAGEIVFARSNDPAHRLGAILVERGLLTEAKLEEILNDASGGVRLGARLIQKGYIKARELYDAVRAQVQEIIYSIFPMTEGVFAFYEGDFLDEDLSQFTLNTQNILMEGYRRLDEWGMMRERLPHDGVVIVAKQHAEAEGLDAHLGQVWQAVDGKRNVKQLMRKTGLGAFELYHALHELLRRGLIEAHDPKEAAKSGGDVMEQMIEGYNKLFVVTVRALAKAGGESYLSDDQLDEVLANLDERASALLKNVYFDPRQGIAHAKQRILDNLQQLAQQQGGTRARIAGLENMFKRQRLQGALDELLNYLLFAVKNGLPPEKADPFIQRIRAAHKKLRNEL